MSDVDTKIIEKVQKLLRLARDKGASENEAAVAMQKVNDLLVEHGLEMAQVEGHKKLDMEGDTSKKSGRNYKYECYVWKGASELNLCGYFTKHLSDGSFGHLIVGTKINIMGAELLADYLLETIKRMAKEWAKRPEAEAIAMVDGVSLPMATHKYKQGLAIQLYRRCLELRDSRLNGTGTALVLYGDHGKAITEWLDQQGMSIQNGKKSHIKTSLAAATGRSDAQKVGLTPQVKGGPSKFQRLGAS